MGDLMRRRAMMAAGETAPQNLPVPYTRSDNKNLNTADGSYASNTSYGCTAFIDADTDSYKVLSPVKMGTAYCKYQVFDGETFLRGAKFSWLANQEVYEGASYYVTLINTTGGTKFRFCWYKKAQGEGILVFRNI